MQKEMCTVLRERYSYEDGGASRDLEPALVGSNLFGRILGG